MFIEESNYRSSATDYVLLKDLYSEYRAFCIEDGNKPVNKQNMRKRLNNSGIQIEKRNIGNVVWVGK